EARGLGTGCPPGEDLELVLELDLRGGVLRGDGDAGHERDGREDGTTGGELPSVDLAGTEGLHRRTPFPNRSFRSTTSARRATFRFQGPIMSGCETPGNRSVAPMRAV